MKRRGVFSEQTFLLHNHEGPCAFVQSHSLDMTGKVRVCSPSSKTWLCGSAGRGRFKNVHYALHVLRSEVILFAIPGE